MIHAVCFTLEPPCRMLVHALTLLRSSLCFRPPTACYSAPGFPGPHRISAASFAQFHRLSCGFSACRPRCQSLHPQSANVVTVSFCRSRMAIRMNGSPESGHVWLRASDGRKNGMHVLRAGRFALRPQPGTGMMAMSPAKTLWDTSSCVKRGLGGTGTLHSLGLTNRLPAS